MGPLASTRVSPFYHRPLAGVKAKASESGSALGGILGCADQNGDRLPWASKVRGGWLGHLLEPIVRLDLGEEGLRDVQFHDFGLTKASPLLHAVYASVAEEARGAAAGGPSADTGQKQTPAPWSD